jgi:hypothetical protein
MKDFKIDKLLILRIVLIFGIIFLAYHDRDGWGWLTFALFLTF